MQFPICYNRFHCVKYHVSDMLDSDEMLYNSVKFHDVLSIHSGRYCKALRYAVKTFYNVGELVYSRVTLVVGN